MLALPRNRLQAIALLLLAAFFVSAGVTHFTRTDLFLAIVPHYLPAPLALVYVSGVFEILGGLGVLWPPSRRLAGFCLIALLLAVYPANVQMALETERWAAQGVEPWQLYLRLPLQFVAIAWAWWATRPETPPARTAEAG
jgi:uncharacterized membrane protein